MTKHEHVNGTHRQNGVCSCGKTFSAFSISECKRARNGVVAKFRRHLGEKVNGY
jgi:hypothetical protein